MIFPEDFCDKGRIADSSECNNPIKTGVMKILKRDKRYMEPSIE
jgi:hypothetical protein